MSHTTSIQVRVAAPTQPAHEDHHQPAPAARRDRLGSQYAALVKRRRTDATDDETAWIEDQEEEAPALDPLADSAPQNEDEAPDERVAELAAEWADDAAGAQQTDVQPDDDAQPDNASTTADDVRAARRRSVSAVGAAGAGGSRQKAEAPTADRVEAAGASAGPAPLSQEQVQFAHLAEFLLGRVADFCSDPSVLSRGHWHLQVPIDPALMPGCTLHLTLSHFDLRLRFDTSDAMSKQLISQHSDILVKRLDALLRQYGSPREIEIVTW
ncbi:hypothetical protein CY652_21845 [Burkholderia sp. WAC0059]|uniref:type III secretion system protein SctP n=1 Tax=Burkholderia sp. WAC0059 TaxID=2066022 RepID=UPI000C7F0E53|nr:type III secretion system protein SctP [Burkholderia sp. WAC0059]PLZ00288.1 hypothetical protein CY652_21845 [Burkholderia sp. WAC0059]